jgi:hypothetical protein
MSSQTQLTKTSEFDSSKLTISKNVSNSGTINVYYNGDRLHLKTDNQICIHGAQVESTSAIVMIIPSPSLRKTMLTLTDILKKIAIKKEDSLPCSEKEEGIEISEILTPEGYLKLYLSLLPNGELRCTVFDKEGDRIESPLTCLTNKFTAKYLLSFKNVYLSKMNKLTWKIDAQQIQVIESSKLPPGCLIVDTEEELLAELAIRKTETLDSNAIGFEVTEEELGKNELID